MIVVAAVFERDGAFLACRRAPGKADAHLWEFPGGKVEPGEAHQDALIREIYEELRVSIEVGGLITRATTAVGDRRIDLSTFRVLPLGPHPTSSSDHDQLRWVPALDLAALQWAKPDLPTVRKLLEGYAVKSTNSRSFDPGT